MASPFYILEKFPLTRRIMIDQYKKRARQIVGKISSFVTNGEKVIDIGCGTGYVAKILLDEKSIKLTSIDLHQHPLCNHYPVLIYDGEKLPFADGSFDTAMLIAVLHHCHKPLNVLEEAIRVSRRKIIVMEDLFESRLEKWLTLVEDSIVNWEFRGHPHNNKQEGEWKEIFAKHHLKIEKQEKFKLVCAGFPFRLGIFILKKQQR